MSGKIYTFKIIIGGDGGVGKTTLLHRYVDEKFSFDTKMTIGVEIFNKEMQNECGKIALQLWDFGGQERFRFFLDSFVSGARGGFLMFDLTRLESFLNLEEWLSILRKQKPDLPLVLLGSKLDIEDSITFDDELAMEFKERYNIIEYLKVSSKTGHNVNKAFELIVQGVLKYLNISK